MSRKSRGRARGRKDRERIVRNLAFLAQSAAEEKKHQENQGRASISGLQNHKTPRHS